MDAEGGNPHPVSTSVTDAYAPDISPDGTRIVYTGGSIGEQEIRVMNIDGANPVQLTADVWNDFDPVWSPDGMRIAFVSNRSGIQQEVWVMDADGSNMEQLTGTGVGGRPGWS